MIRFIVLAFLVSSSAAAQEPPQKNAFFRDDGQPKDRFLLKASRDCHAHNPKPADAKENCAVVDNQITKRAMTEPNAAKEIKDRATEITK